MSPTRLLLSSAGGLLIVALLSGCPVPIPPLGYSSLSRSNVPDKVPDFIVKGSTTRADVLLALGAPDAAAPDATSFVYRSERHTGGVAFVVVAGGGAGGVGMNGYVERLLVVRFDPSGVVTDAALEERVCRRGAAAMGSAGAESPPCLPVPDAAQLTPANGSGETVEVFEGAVWTASRENPLLPGEAARVKGRIAVLSNGVIAEASLRGAPDNAKPPAPFWFPFSSMARVYDVQFDTGGATLIATHDGRVYVVAFPVQGGLLLRSDGRVSSRLTERLRAGIAQP